MAKKKKPITIDGKKVVDPPKEKKVKKKVIHEPAEGWLPHGLKEEIKYYEDLLTRHYDPEGTITSQGETKDGMPFQVRLEMFSTLDSLHRLVKIYDTPN